MEDKESLETCTSFRKLSNSVKNKINNLLANGVVAPGVVVGRVLLARHQLLGVKQLTVGSGPHL